MATGDTKGTGNGVADRCGRARAAFDRRAWGEAAALLAAVDDDGELGAEDLERLAESSYLTGRYAVAEDAWARAHEAWLERGEVLAAVRAAFWLGLVLLTGMGAPARGGGWIARARRVLDDRSPSDDAAERGYLLLPVALSTLHGTEPAAAHDLFRRATAIGREVDEPDLIAIGRLGQAQSLLRSGEARRGAELLDELLVDLASRGVSTIAAGLVHCAAIHACHQVHDVRRAQQWTQALTQWCEDQRDLVPYRGECLVHRSELAQLRGDWEAAVRHAARACATLGDPPGGAAAMAHYQRAELHRLRGEHDAAEAAFARAADCGRDPQPGLALLRRDQGRTAAAVAAIRRVLAQTDQRLPPVADEARAPQSRAELLAAGVEILLEAGDRAGARASADELDEIAADLATPSLDAMAAHARGAVLLADGEPGAALAALTRARRGWTELQAPHRTACVRAELAAALREVGDEDTAALEWRAARRTLRDLGATPDLQRLALADIDTPDDDGAVEAGDGHVRAGVGDGAGAAAGLTPREVEVVRLVAAGRTNREIADELVISHRTVARHLHNVFTRLDLPNRAAATAYAYEHDLV